MPTCVSCRTGTSLRRKGANMVILDGRFVYADYEQTDVFGDFPIVSMGDCISYLNDRRTFVYDTGVLEDVKVQDWYVEPM